MKKETTTTVIKGVKAFDKDFKCRDKQYSPNSEHLEQDAKICEHGMHFCENPLDVFRYYEPALARFAEVEGSGKIDKKSDDEDTKISCTNLKIGVELSLQKIIEGGIKFIFDRTTKKTLKTNDKEKLQASNSGYRGAASNSGDSGAASNSGDSGAASNSGYRGAASNSGYSGAASNSGYRGAASNSGYSGAASNSGDSGAAFTIGSYSSASTNADNSVAVAVGYENKAKASIGSWIVLAERNDDGKILGIKCVMVDGKDLLADTFYKLSGSKFVIA